MTFQIVGRNCRDEELVAASELIDKLAIKLLSTRFLCSRVVLLRLKMAVRKCAYDFRIFGLLHFRGGMFSRILWRKNVS
jgi:hypothetical protein